jgi:YbgC/YbaW family acyl-CoA thioester hydrolase
MNSKFSTEMPVRPDDIDMFAHVHNSRYLDYVQAARFDQMTHHYKFSMQDFLHMGFGWVVKKATVNYKRALVMGDIMIVHTQVMNIDGSDCTVDFEIINKRTQKIACDGQMIYTMTSMKTGRAEKIPDNIKAKYLI